MLEIRVPETLNAPSLATRGLGALQADLDVVALRQHDVLQATWDGTQYAGDTTPATTALGNKTFSVRFTETNPSSNPPLKIGTTAAAQMRRSTGEGINVGEIVALATYKIVKISSFFYVFGLPPLEIAAETAARIAADEAETAARTTWNNRTHRPGEIPEAFTHSLAGGDPVALASIDEDLIETDTEGPVARAAGEITLARRATFPLEPNRKYKVQWAFRRHTNTPDPANDAVRSGIAWFNNDKEALSQTVVDDNTTLTTGSGIVTVSAVVSRSAGDGVTVVAPAGARFWRPFWQTFGDDPTTELLWIRDPLDVTDLAGLSPDLDAVESAITALQSVDAGNRLDAVESTLGGAEVARYKDVATAEAATPLASVDFIETLDPTHETYERVGSDPGSVPKLQTADGAWWLRIQGDADEPAALAGTNDVDRMTPLRSAQQLVGHEFSVPRVLFGYTPANPAHLRRRWESMGLDFVADLGAIGNNASPAADTAAWLEFADILGSRGTRLRIPDGNFHIDETAIFDSSRNVLIEGMSGGNASRPSTIMFFKGTDVRGFFYCKSVFQTIFRGINFLLDAPGIDHHGIIGANPGPDNASSIQVLFDYCGFAATPGNFPAQSAMWIRNCQEVVFNLCTWTQCEYAMLIGDIANIESGVAGGGAGRVTLIEPFLSASIQLRRGSQVGIIGGALLENHDTGESSSIVALVGSQTLGLTLDRVELAGNANQTPESDDVAVNFQTGEYQGLAVRNCRIVAYNAGVRLAGADGDDVVFEGNSLQQGATATAASPIGLLVGGSYGGKVRSELNTMSADMISNGGVVMRDDRTEVNLLARLGTHAVLAANVTLTVHASNWNNVLETSAFRTNGDLWSITGLITLANAAVDTAVTTRVLYNGVEVARSRTTNSAATAGNITTIPLDIVAKLGPATGALRIEILQQVGTGAVVRGTAGNGMTHISARKIQL